MQGIFNRDRQQHYSVQRHEEINTSENISNQRDRTFSRSSNGNYIRSTAVVKKDQGNYFRVRSIISEIHHRSKNDSNDKHKRLKNDSKQLARFLIAFLSYTLFGAFVFFYIEECSGADVVSDASADYAKGRVYHPTYSDRNKTCLLLYVEAYNSGTNQSQKNYTNTNKNCSTGNEYCLFLKLTNQNVSSIPRDVFYSNFAAYNKACDIEFNVALQNSIILEVERHHSCHLNSEEILKFTHFTMFTLCTIGYGRKETTPITNTGRGILMVYAITGIPITVTTYKVAAKIQLELIKLFFTNIEYTLYGHRNPKKLHLKVLLFCIFILLLLVILGSLITSSETMENWSFSTSFYFWFVSMTIIGYGDLNFDYKKQHEHPVLMVCALSILLLGLSMSVTIAHAFALTLCSEKDKEETDIPHNLDKLDNEMGRVLLQLGLFQIDETCENEETTSQESVETHL